MVEVGEGAYNSLEDKHMCLATGGIAHLLSG